MVRAFIQSRSTNDLPGADAVPGLNWSGIVLVLVLVLAYLLGFARIGFIPATAIFFPVTCFVLGYRNMVVTGLVTILAIVLIWYLFTRGFSIRPPGIGFDDLWRMLAGAD